MLKALDINRKTTAYLENAYNVSYEKQTNTIWSASFFMPLNDPKVDKINQLGFIEITDIDGEYIGLFRVMPKETSISVEANRVKFELQHVLSTLMDSVIFGYHEISPNTKTVDVLNYLIGLQKVKHWKLGLCEFTRYFQYSWENENGLINAIWSIPQPFDEEYEWTFDTKSYPWTLNLVKPSTMPTCRVQEGYNLKGFTVEENPNQLINRIYPLGQGEGVNQLNISKVNPTGQKYVEDATSIAKYGLVEYVWVDRRFTDASSLMSSANSLLKKFKQPIVTWEINAADLIKAIPRKPDQIIPKIDELREGKVVRVKTNKFGVLNLRILKESKSDMFKNPIDCQLSVGYVPSDLGTTQADIERNIEINQLYSQGATNILNYDKADNCDPSFPMKFSIFIDDDVVKINTIELTFETAKYRAYSRAIAGGGALVGSTAAGGYTASSTAGGGASVQGGTSQSGGASVQSSTSSSGGGQTSSASGDHTHVVATAIAGPVTDKPLNIVRFASGGEIYCGTNITGDLVTKGSSGSHSHTVSSHTHNVSVNIPAHTHGFSVNIPSHTHNFTVPAHTHQIELPDHTHEIEYGIFEESDTASAVTIKVAGNLVPGTETSRERFNLVPYFPKNEDGTIRRGKTEIEITPNKRARIEAQITARVFIKSQLGGDF